MLENALRDQAAILRSLADELDSIASVYERERHEDAASTNAWTTLPAEDATSSDSTVAEPDGRVDVWYNMCTSGRVNLERSLSMAREDAKNGRVVGLNFGTHQIFLTKDNYDTEVPLP